MPRFVFHRRQRSARLAWRAALSASSAEAPISTISAVTLRWARSAHFEAVEMVMGFSFWMGIEDWTPPVEVAGVAGVAMVLIEMDMVFLLGTKAAFSRGCVTHLSAACQLRPHGHQAGGRPLAILLSRVVHRLPGQTKTPRL
jgi:hypothetical protein